MSKVRHIIEDLEDTEIYLGSAKNIIDDVLKVKNKKKSLKYKEYKERF